MRAAPVISRRQFLAASALGAAGLAALVGVSLAGFGAAILALERRDVGR